MAVGMKAYIDGMRPARISRERRRQPTSPLTPPESILLRSLVGQLTWVARCLLPQVSVPVSELAGHLSTPTVENLVKANCLVQRVMMLSFLRPELPEMTTQRILLGLGNPERQTMTELCPPSLILLPMRKVLAGHKSPGRFAWLCITPIATSVILIGAGFRGSCV